MRMFRAARWFLLALLLSLVPASSYAGVFISVGFAPPMLPVYEQPLCPEAGWMWTPGYWAYGDDGYYWVPGAWVPAPYEGALWTPGYWGWGDGLYIFHPGYWGRHVGYYGGVNYGFGYMGIGFVGGRWHGRDFEYNTAVVHVDERRIRTTYVDREVVNRYTVQRDSHVAYSGGPGGIRHDPRPEERVAEHEQHVQTTSSQTQHESMAMRDRTSYVKTNGGHPTNLAVSRPMGMGNRTPAAGERPMAHDDRNAPGRSPSSPQVRMRQEPQPSSRPGSQIAGPVNHSGPGPITRPGNESRPMYAPQPAPRVTTQPRSEPQTRQAQTYRPAPQPQSRPAPQSRPVPEPRAVPQSRPAPQQQSRPAPAPRAEHERK